VRLTPALAALSFVALFVVVAGGWAWLLAAAKAVVTWRWLPAQMCADLSAALVALRLNPRLPLVSSEPRRPVPWALFDLVILLGLWLVASLTVSVVLHQGDWLKRGGDMENLALAERETLIVANVVISLLIVGVGLPLVALRTGATLRDFGWSPQHVLSDIRFGLIAFVMLAPPVYALQGVLVSVWKKSTHPLVEMFRETPDPMLFFMLLLTAGIVAPVFEELIFRVLLQGFLEKAFGFRGRSHELLFGNGSRTDASATGHQETISGVVIESPDANPYAPPAMVAVEGEQLQADLSDEQSPSGSLAWMPIGISSSVFALLHYSHGPDWVPLILLAAGMGYLYQRTHRLLPSLTVHVLLNCLSMWGLWVQVKAG